MKTISWFLAINALAASSLFAQAPTPTPAPKPAPAPAPVVPVAATSPPPFTVSEHNQDGKDRTVDEKMNIVDIGSNLTITLDKAAITAAIGKSGFATAQQSELLARITDLQKLLMLRDSSLDSLQQSLRAHAAAIQNGDPASRATAKQQMRAAAQPLDQFFQSPGYSDTSPLAAAFGAALDTGGTIFDKFTAVYNVVAGQIKTLEQQVSTTTPGASDGVYVQLGAWIVTDSSQRPIHLDGFDDYPVGSTFVINRWNLALTPDQEQQLAQYTQLAAQVNAKGSSALIDWKSTGERLLSQVDQTPTGQCVKDLSDQIDMLAKLPAMQAQQIQSLLTAMKTSITTYQKSLTDIGAKYKTNGSATKLTPDQFLSQSNSDLTTIVSSTTGLLANLNAGTQSIATTVKSAPAAIQQAVTALGGKVGDCAKQATEAFGALQSELSNLLAGRNVDVAALELGDQVKKLSLDSLPASTTVSLNQTGVRESGDVIAIKIAAGTTTENRQDLYHRQLTMFQVIPHLDLKVGLIYANAEGQSSTTSTTTTTTGDTTKNKHHFQAAPAYSILFKKGSYTSATYNRWIDAGIGLNLSSLDFNHDDVQELGIAIVGSIFRDYLQLGYGYNVTESRRYWFFGLRLPLPYFTLPLANNSTPAPK